MRDSELNEMKWNYMYNIKKRHLALHFIIADIVIFYSALSLTSVRITQYVIAGQSKNVWNCKKKSPNYEKLIFKY